MPHVAPVHSPQAEAPPAPPESHGTLPQIQGCLSAMVAYITAVLNEQGTQSQIQAQEAISMSEAAQAQTNQATNAVQTVATEVAQQQAAQQHEEEEEKKWGWLGKFLKIFSIFSACTGVGMILSAIMTIPSLAPSTKAASAINSVENSIADGIEHAASIISSHSGALTKLFQGTMTLFLASALGQNPLIFAGQSPKFNFVQQMIEGFAMAATGTNSNQTLKTNCGYVALGIQGAIALGSAIAMFSMGNVAGGLSLFMRTSMQLMNVVQGVTEVGSGAFNIWAGVAEYKQGKFEEDVLASAQSNMVFQQALQQMLSHISQDVNTARQNGLSAGNQMDQSLFALANPYSAAAQLVG